MKRLLIGILLLTLLAGCGAEGRPEPPEPAPESPEAPVPEGLAMELEHPVYDPSQTRYTYFIWNHTAGPVELGDPCAIQRREGGRWTDLTPQEDYGFTSIGYFLEPGGIMALTCTLAMYQEAPEPGEYRLVKQVADHTLYAEFTLGESPYTAEAPYGFGPLEDLPEPCGADAASELDVVFTRDGVRNLRAAEDFLFKVQAGAPCQLRTVQDYGEGAPMAVDVIFENDHFLWRMRSSGTVAERRFSYLVTDGQDLYLSNGADWASGEKYGDERTLLIPEGAPPEMAAVVEDMTIRRMEGNTARYRIWSGDGVRDAALTDVPTEFSVGWQRPGEGGRGAVYDLQNWDGMETSILSAAWQWDGTLFLECETSVGEISCLEFDPETERLTAVQGRIMICGDEGPLCRLPPALQ